MGIEDDPERGYDIGLDYDYLLGKVIRLDHELKDSLDEIKDFTIFEPGTDIIAMTLRYISRTEELCKDSFVRYLNSEERESYVQKIALLKDREQIKDFLEEFENPYILFDVLCRQISKFVSERINDFEILKEIDFSDLFNTLTMSIEIYKLKDWVVDEIFNFLYCKFSSLQDCCLEDSIYDHITGELLDHLSDKQFDKSSYDQYRAKIDFQQSYEKYKDKWYTALTEKEQKDPIVLIDCLLVNMRAWSSVKKHYPLWYQQRRKKLILSKIIKTKPFVKAAWLVDEVCEAFLPSDIEEQEKTLKEVIKKQFVEYLKTVSEEEVQTSAKPIADVEDKATCIYY